MQENSIELLSIRGFKSIQNLETFKLKNLNIFIGANGSGKSNLVSFFHLLSSIKNETLNSFVRNNGGADNIVFNGPKNTESVSFEVRVHKNEHAISLLLTPHSTFEVAQIPSNIRKAIPMCQIYHFNDTTLTAKMRRYEIIQDNSYLRNNGSNIAPYLLYLSKNAPYQYKVIRNAIRLVIPFFDDFLLKIEKLGQNGEQEQVNLSWSQKSSDFPMQPYHLSDGSIRFICLATALLQPDPPPLIIIDEPELGLHPEAIAILAELIDNAAFQTQVIITTQSPALIDHFSIKNIIVVRREHGASTYTRLQKKDFKVWLKEYSIGELWSRNIIDGGPEFE